MRKDDFHTRLERIKTVAVIDAILTNVQKLAKRKPDAEYRKILLDTLGARALSLLPKDIIGISFADAGIGYEVKRPEEEYAAIPEEQRGVWQLWQLDRFAQTNSPLPRQPIFLPPKVA